MSKSNTFIPYGTFCLVMLDVGMNRHFWGAQTSATLPEAGSPKVNWSLTKKSDVKEFIKSDANSIGMASENLQLTRLKSLRKLCAIWRGGFPLDDMVVQRSFLNEWVPRCQELVKWIQALLRAGLGKVPCFPFFKEQDDWEGECCIQHNILNGSGSDFVMQLSVELTQESHKDVADQRKNKATDRNILDASETSQVMKSDGFQIHQAPVLGSGFGQIFGTTRCSNMVGRSCHSRSHFMGQKGPWKNKHQLMGGKHERLQ